MENRDRYPVLAHVLQSMDTEPQSNVELVHHLYPILRWVHLAHGVFDHRITREDAGTKSIADVLEDHANLVQPFDALHQAWNSVRNITTR